MPAIPRDDFRRNAISVSGNVPRITTEESHFMAPGWSARLVEVKTQMKVPFGCSRAERGLKRIDRHRLFEPQMSIVLFNSIGNAPFPGKSHKLARGIVFSHPVPIKEYALPCAKSGSPVMPNDDVIPN
jgi:hypothetical protein